MFHSFNFFTSEAGGFRGHARFEGFVLCTGQTKGMEGKFLSIDFNNRTERKTVKPDNNLIPLLITSKNREVDVQCEQIWPRKHFSNFYLSFNEDFP